MNYKKQNTDDNTQPLTFINLYILLIIYFHRIVIDRNNLINEKKIDSKIINKENIKYFE